MLELNRQVRDLFVSYQRKSLKPETALELVSDFVLDLINVFGDTLDQGAAPKEKWRLFAPFEFILGSISYWNVINHPGTLALNQASGSCSRTIRCCSALSLDIH